MICVDLIVVVLVVIGGVIAFFKWKFSYWYNKNVPFIEPQIPFGSSENPFKRKVNSVIIADKYYHHFKSNGCKYGGLYSSVRPALLLIDLDLIRKVMLNDFEYFTDRGLYCNEKSDPLSAHLFNLEGNKWRSLRAKLSPTFTSGRIKSMFSTLVDCGVPLRKAIEDLQQKGDCVDIKDVSGRFTTDVIGSCAFGLDCNSFKNPNSEFRMYGKMVFSVSSKVQALKNLIAFSYPAVAKRLGLKVNNPVIEKFFLNIVKDVVDHRKINNIERNDFMQLVMNIKNEYDGTRQGLSIEEMAAQAFVFFLAGFETSSTTMTFCLLELSMHQEIQNSVRDEINTVLHKHNDNITYDAVMEMNYLGRVIDETLRKYPPVTSLLRVCTKDYQIPGTKITLPKGTRIVIPVYSLQHDTEYFSDPESFNPERFNDQNKQKIVPFSYMPFGEGPRICIGLRFGLLQTKVGLITLLRNFRFLLNKKTQLPIKFEPRSVIPTVEGGIWLDIEKISERTDLNL